MKQHFPVMTAALGRLKENLRGLCGDERRYRARRRALAALEHAFRALPADHPNYVLAAAHLLAATHLVGRT